MSARLPGCADQCAARSSDSAVAAQVATYGALVIEGALAVPIWHLRTRWTALVAALVLHPSIDATTRVGFFTLAVLIAYTRPASPAPLVPVVRAAQGTVALPFPRMSARGPVGPSLPVRYPSAPR